MNAMIPGQIGRPVAFRRRLQSRYRASSRNGSPVFRAFRLRAAVSSDAQTLQALSALTQRVAEAPRGFRVNACLRAARTGRRDSDDVRPSPGFSRKSGRRFTADQAPRIEERVSQLPHAQPVARFLGVLIARRRFVRSRTVTDCVAQPPRTCAVHAESGNMRIRPEGGAPEQGRGWIGRRDRAMGALRAGASPCETPAARRARSLRRRSSGIPPCIHRKGAKTGRMKERSFLRQRRVFRVPKWTQRACSVSSVTCVFVQ